MAPAKSRLPVWQLTVEELRDQLRRERDQNEDRTKLARTRLTTINRQRKCLAEKDEQLGRMNEDLAHMHMQLKRSVAENEQLHIQLAAKQHETGTIHLSATTTASSDRRSPSIASGLEALSMHSPLITSGDESASSLSTFQAPFSQQGSLPAASGGSAAPTYAPSLCGSAATQQQMTFYGPSYDQAPFGVQSHAQRTQA
ncbi:MAG: hypothetical protein LQ346_002084 [Caloplaca aetnensis]|nr:MAG: hypothetical protein LQ346_002084 [Caloplaca aetnensis]